MFGGDSDLYELMQALEVMAQLLSTFHSPPNSAAIALRDLIVHFALNIASPPLMRGLRQDPEMTFTVQHNSSGLLDLTYCAQGCS